jgi:hypothetical protein
MAKSSAVKIPVNPRNIFIAAESCRAESLPIYARVKNARPGYVKFTDDEWYQLIPGITLHAFAFELFIKCLIVSDSGLYGQEHNTEILFGLLNADRRQEIQRRYDVQELEYRNDPGHLEFLNANPKTDFRLEAVIKRSAHAFTDNRYLFEYDRKTTSPIQISGVSNIIREMLLELNPDWHSIVRKVQYRPTSPDH